MSNHCSFPKAQFFRIKTKTFKMLLPDPSKYNPPKPSETTNYDKKKVFFEQAELDEMAKYFIGNMTR